MASLRYPAEIIDDTTDWFRIGIAKYEPGASTAQSTISSFIGSQNSYQENEVVILPMPSNIQDGNSVSYGDDKLNTLTAQGLNIAQTAMGTTLQEVMAADTTKLQSASNQVLDLVKDPDLQSIIMKSLAAQAVSVFGGNVSIDSLMARESGTIMNPNMELLFNGVTLRSFRFSFKMTPRDDKESDNIKAIIRTLKTRMAAKGGTGENFLSTPDVFNLSYRKGKDKHPFLHSFKPCFLKDMSINYTGENVYASYSDGTPVSMIMDLSFQEMFPIYDKDYNDIPDTGGVGY